MTITCGVHPLEEGAGEVRMQEGARADVPHRGLNPAKLLKKGSQSQGEGGVGEEEGGRNEVVQEVSGEEVNHRVQ